MIPRVSIILPIRNEAKYIRRCLQAILSQDYPGNLEIVIADGMSIDDTRSIIQDISKQSRFPIAILDNPKQIVPTGLNSALRQSKGDILIRVDGHCIIAPDYVSKCVEHIKKHGIDGVGSPMDSVGETQIAKVIAVGMSSPFGVGNSAFRTTSGKSRLVDTVPFPAYTRKIIEQVGLYDEELVRNQDDEYNYRIRKMGGKILLADDIRSTYFSRSSLKGLWRQYFQYGFWKVRVLQKHSRQMSPRQFVPPTFVTSLLVSIFLLFVPFPSFFLHPSSFVPLLYLLANLTASIWTVIKNNRITHNSLFTTLHFLLLLPPTYAILHLSYGFGFLVGLVKFWKRWGDKIGMVPTFPDQFNG